MCMARPVVGGGDHVTSAISCACGLIPRPLGEEAWEQGITCTSSRGVGCTYTALPTVCRSIVELPSHYNYGHVIMVTFHYGYFYE